MAARRSTELRTVPEYDRLSAAQGGDGGAATAAATASYPSGQGPTPRDARSGMRSGSGGIGIGTTGSGNRDGGGFGSGGGGSGNLSHSSTTRLARGTSGGRQGGQAAGGALGRTSLVVRIQQGGRQLIDMGRLQADWLSSTLVKRTDEHDYVNEEDQGLVALLARHVDVEPAAWDKLQRELGGRDGHYWQSGAPGEFNRSSQGPHVPHVRDGGSAPDHGGGAAENGEAPKPRKSIFGMRVIQPYNLFAVLWTLLILFLDLTYTAFWVPMNVAFCTSEYGKLSSACTTSDLVGGALYLMNLLLGFQIGVVATIGIRKRIVQDGCLVARLYLRHGKFWEDFVAIVPLLYLIVVLAGQSHFRLNRGWVNCLSLLRLLRMVRLVSITKVVYMDSLSGRFQDSWKSRWLSVTLLYSIFLAYQLAVAINLFACIMVLCAYFEGYENSWMTAVDWANLPNASPLYQWYCAVYWMIVTATTTGFGDFQPRSTAEQVVANVAMVGGMIMFGVLVASIGQALSRATREAHQAYSARQKIARVMEWAQHRDLKDDIKKEVQLFFADKYGRKDDEGAVDTLMMSVLPSRLRAKVARSICGSLLSNVHVLDALPFDVQELLAENMRPLRLPAGEDLCQQGDVTNCLWILQEGRVEAVRYKEQPKSLDASDKPHLLGESVLLGEAVEAARVRPWTLRTVKPCRLWGIPLGELYPLMRMYPVIGHTAADYVKHKTLAMLSAAQQERQIQQQHFQQQQQQQQEPQQESLLLQQQQKQHQQQQNEQQHRQQQRQQQQADEAGGSSILGSGGHNKQEGHWCEVAAVIVRQLLEFTPEEEAEELVRELERADAYEGTLQPLLEQLLEFCATRRGAPAVVRAPPQGPTSAPRRDGRTLATPTHGPPDGGGAGGGGEHPPPLSPQPFGLTPSAAAAAAGKTAFGTPAAAAALSAALLAATSPGQTDAGQHHPHLGLHPGQQQSHPQHPHPHPRHLQHQLQQLYGNNSSGGAAPQGLHHSFTSGGGSAAAAANSGGGGAANSARPSTLPPMTSPVPLSLSAAAAAAAAVQCPGCQRCICPSCGQGMDTAAAAAAAAGPPLMAGAADGGGGGAGAAGLAHTLHGGGGGAAAAAAATGRAGAAPPGMRAWINVNRGTLRRVSIGMRADKVWATERRSIDRRLGAMSVVSVYE
ncbi:hypothetical protein PLESTM_001194500 [Pleodorina starrii]|nr:hypothetical protein PLESTM_001194500 [Pleodorina starrii]